MKQKERRLPDSLKSLGHGVLAPGCRVTSTQFNPLSLASAVQRSRGYAELSRSPLHGRLTRPYRFQSAVQVGGGPGGGAGVERRG